MVGVVAPLLLLKFNWEKKVLPEILKSTAFKNSVLFDPFSMAVFFYQFCSPTANKRSINLFFLESVYNIHIFLFNHIGLNKQRELLLFLFKENVRFRKMAQQIKVLSEKPEDLSSFPKHMWQEKIDFHKLSSDFYIHIIEYECMHTCTNTQSINKT